MGGRDAPFRRDARRSIISPTQGASTSRSRTRSAARSRPRMRAHRSAPSRAVDRGACVLYRRAREDVRGTASSVRRRRERAARLRKPRRLRTPHAAPGRTRAARPHSPHPRRPASRQYRADRRAPGAVRRHRVQRHHRLRRPALRSRLRADGPYRARTWRGRQHRAQPLSRRHKARRGPRCARRTCRSICRCGRRSAPR